MAKENLFPQTIRIAIPLVEPGQKAKPKVLRPVPKRKGPAPAPPPSARPAGAAVYQELLQSLYDGVLITNLAGRIEDVNDRAMEFLGYAKEELSRLNIINIIAGADETLLETLRRNIENHRYTLIEAYCIRKDHTTFPAEIATNQLVLTQAGHFCFFVRNITRRKQAEEELTQTVSRLKELDLSRSRFVSNVTHELRTPLTIINSFVSLVHDGVAGPVTEQQQECLITVLRNCDRLAGLIENVLDLGRIESGREKFRRQRVDLVELLKQSHHDFLPKCLINNQQLNLDLPEQLPAVLCDRDKIAQVLTNLLGNANKFTPENGVITLRAIQAGALVRVDVADTGIGIRPEDQGRLFEAFVQIDRPTGGTENKGTGLGLAISKHIIDVHEGSIRVESTPGKGSRFYFTLPVYTEHGHFDAFVNDRRRFLETRKRPLVMLVLQASAAVPEKTAALQPLWASILEALNCAEEQAFYYAARGVLIVLLDGAELTRAAVVSRLQKKLDGLPPAPVAELPMAYLPAQPDQPPQVWLAAALALLEPLPLPPPAEVAPRRVLIVDDDDAILNLMVRVLHESGAGLDLKSTTSGYDACIHFGEWKPDLVVLDLHLSDIDGKRVFESMTKRQPRRAIKFLVVSGYRGDIDEMMKLGCDDFICKPFDFDEFVKKVRRLLNPAEPPAAASRAPGFPGDAP